jgi:hypothetical protein
MVRYASSSTDHCCSSGLDQAMVVAFQDELAQ